MQGKGNKEVRITIDKSKETVTLDFTKSSDFDHPFIKMWFSRRGYKSKPKTEDIDYELRPLIRDMHDNNYRTFLSCSGHNKTNGFLLYLPPRKRRLRGIIWEPDGKIPQTISEIPSTAQKLCSIIIDEGKEAMQFWRDQLKEKGYEFDKAEKIEVLFRR